MGGMNPADYFLDVASGWSGETKGRKRAIYDDPALETLLGAIEKKPYVRKVTAFATNLEASSVGSTEEFCGHQRKKRDKLEGPSYLTQMRVICTRSLKERRFERFDADTVGTNLFMAVLFGVLWWQNGRGAKLATTEGATNVAAVLFLIVSMISLRLFLGNLFTFPDEKTMLLKEREAGMYPISAFFFGRTVADTPLDMAIPVMVVTIIYLMVGLKPTVGAFLLTMIVVLITCFTAASLGLLVGAAFLNLKRAQSAAVIIMLTLMLTGGFFVQNIPAWLSWLSYLSYINYAWDALKNIQLDGRIPTCTDPSECTMINTTVFTHLGPQFGILLGMLVVFRFGVYLSLRYGAKSR